MAKLPYTWTVVPPNDPPEKLFTASCKEIGNLLKQSPNGDLTINQKRDGMWQSWEFNTCDTPVDLGIRQAIAKVRARKNT